jgi:hypothetical protein
MVTVVSAPPSSIDAAAVGVGELPGRAGLLKIFHEQFGGQTAVYFDRLVETGAGAGDDGRREVGAEDDFAGEFLQRIKGFGDAGRGDRAGRGRGAAAVLFSSRGRTCGITVTPLAHRGSGFACRG